MPTGTLHILKFLKVYSAVYTVTIRVVDLNQTGSEPFTCRILTRGNKNNINYSILKKILIHIRI